MWTVTVHKRLQLGMALVALYCIVKNSSQHFSSCSLELHQNIQQIPLALVVNLLCIVNNGMQITNWIVSKISLDLRDTVLTNSVNNYLLPYQKLLLIVTEIRGENDRAGPFISCKRNEMVGIEIIIRDSSQIFQVKSTQCFSPANGQLFRNVWFCKRNNG